jgi:hypothetical protein
VVFQDLGRTKHFSGKPFVRIGRVNDDLYAQGSTKVLRTIKKGVGYPYALAIDGSGNLYVGNWDSPLRH